tara:strand:+ start:23295 stop:24662 length:1368 start_codon:yes stop_codon:yes gene_type:complete
MNPHNVFACDFEKHVTKKAFFSDGDKIIVAVSGGLDSLVLLHLLRFTPGLPKLNLIIAHFDHNMRPESSSDSSWVCGLAKAWDIPFRQGIAESSLASESEARTARYKFLEAEYQSLGARWIVTGHHADDQAETVLFRIARGTGIYGLKGIPEQRDPGILRPLLPFTRFSIESYAKSVGIRPLLDSSNENSDFARNVIRNEILPHLEAEVAPGIRTSLLRLARIAQKEENAWHSVITKILKDFVLESSDTRIVVDRNLWLEYDSEVQARLLRALLACLEIRIDESGTSSAVEFTRVGDSGKEHWITGFFRLSRAFDHLIFEITSDRDHDCILEVNEPGHGQGCLVIGGRSWSVSWSLTGALGGKWVESFALADLAFPVRMRKWMPGDRVRLSYGSKKLKKIFGEIRVPVDERSKVPVVVDGHDRVLWVPGISRSCLLVPIKGENELSISLSTPGIT